ncbi:MAG: winged helix-turn-helix domain-containing protein [Acidobacteriia bacterium]|nr:winged helix-turn-helix domain-containing protein [Terriglobia bacterium]
MNQSLADLLTEQASRTFIGRTQEMESLLETLDASGPSVTFLHGIGGIGKSRLLSAFAQRARAAGASVIVLNCHLVEPTEAGFWTGLSAALGEDLTSPQEANTRLASLHAPVVIALDNYEVFRLLDAWLRQTFVPSLPPTARIILCGREFPVTAWLSAPGWDGMFRAIELDGLAAGEAVELLAGKGISEERAARINRIACGHPLALTLAASTLTNRRAPVLEETAINRVIDELTRMYLADIADPLTRRTLEAASVIRRATVSLLKSMLPDAAPQDIFERLRALPFVQTELDGLKIHDSVQQVIATALKAADPSKYQAFRRAAWYQLRSELAAASPTELWRYTADMLYLLENPFLREAFFPTGAQICTVEPARPQDKTAILSICKQHDGPVAAACIGKWWHAAPQAFHAIRDESGKTVGFYCMFDAALLDSITIPDDPIVRSWLDHLRENPLPKMQRALFMRRWLSQDAGEAPSPIQAAGWLDIKRTYLSLRPRLRRVYFALRDLPAYASVASTLEIRPVEGAQVRLGKDVYQIAMLDFGPSSVDGWLARLAAGELGVTSDDLLDVDARELIVDSRRVGLTALEFAVIHYLSQREGKAVNRTSLIEDVWGYKYDVGSNVVDAVIKSLRKKLGKYSKVIETVPGFGYRFRQSQPAMGSPTP